MKRLFNDLKEWWGYLMETQEVKRKARRLTRACKLSDKLTLGDRKTRYVIEKKGGFMILSTRDIDLLKSRGVFRKEVSIYNILKTASYISTTNPLIRKTYEDLHPKQA